MDEKRREMMKKKLILAVLAISLFMTGCASVNITITKPDKAESEKESVLSKGIPWIDSELKENLSEDMPVDPKDDFHLYANKEWLLDSEIPSGYTAWSHYTERGLEVKKQCMDLLKKDDLTGHDAELIQTYNDLILDWDARNASQVSEIQDLYDAVSAADDIEDITAFLTDSATSDMLFSFFNYSACIGFNDPEKYIVGVDTPSLLLGDSAEYPERTELGDMYYGYAKDMFIYISGKLGEEKSQAEEKFDSAIELETKLAEKIYTTKEQKEDDYFDRINNEMPFEEVTELAEVFPLGEILTSSGYEYPGMYLVTRPDYFELLDEVYTDENLDGIKNLMLVKYLLGYQQVLDRETYERSIEAKNEYFGTSGSLSDEEMAYNMVSSMLPASMQKVYISEYGSEEDKKKMNDLCQEVIDTYREMLSENQWASDEVRNYAIEKIDKMKIHAAYPDKFRDTSGIDIKGCSLLEARERIIRTEEEYSKSLIGTSKDKDMWAEGFDILSCNAFYDLQENTINMIIGMMGEPFFSSEMGTEELYASIGAFWVGHEISHAFDSTGAQFDAEGKFRDWWTEEDRAEFDRRVSKMDDYLDKIVAFDDKHFIGKNIDTEMVADMTGLQCALRMASKVDGFDYDRFFRKYAQMNASLSVYSYELSTLTQDEHPLDYSRTNVPVQQFEEFYATYDVKGGDNMYLAPEERLVIW